VDKCFLETASRIYDLVTSGTIDTNVLGSGVQRRTSTHPSRSSSMYSTEPSRLDATYSCCT
jgi:hypothetical protein